MPAYIYTGTSATLLKCDSTQMFAKKRRVKVEPVRDTQLSKHIVVICLQLEMVTNKTMVIHHDSSFITVMNR